MYGFALLFLLGSVFDAIDGYVARYTGKVSLFGGFFDSVCDRVADFFIIAAFGYAGLVAWEIVVLAILTTFLVSYIRARAEAAQKGKKMDSGIFQRTGRFLVVLGGLIFYLLILDANILTWMFVVLILLNITTIIQRVYAVYLMKD